MKKILPFMLFVLITASQKSHSQSAGDYKTVASGNWSDITIWQWYSGSGWIAATAPPTNDSGVITIATGDSVAVISNTYADQLVVNTGATLYITGSRLFLMNGAGTDLLCNGNIHIDYTGVINDDTLTGGSTIDYRSASFTSWGGCSPIITFDGSVAQTIVGGGYFGQLAVNNPQNLTIINVPGFSGANFISGKVIVLPPDGGFLISQYTSGFTGQNATSFIDGRMVYIAYTNDPLSITLPIGLGNEYLPITFNVQQNANSQTDFTFLIHDTVPPTHSLPPSLDRVSTVRYFTVTRDATASITSSSIQLTYDSTDGVSDPTNLRVAKSDTANTNAWVNIGGVGTAAKDGTIASTVNFTTMGDFVLANNTGGSNTLPLRFLTFTAALQKQTAVLNWSTTAEANTSNFIVERKQANSNWETVGSVTANNQPGVNKYSFSNNLQTSGDYFYRVTEVDKDGASYYSNVLLLRLGNTGVMSVTGLYPNPARDVINYFVSSGSNDDLSIAIADVSGKLISLQHSSTNQSLQVPVKNLASGTYFVIFTNTKTGEKITKKFIKM